MHIAHYTNAYLPVISGVVRSVSAFRTALTELGHNVFVFAQQQPDYKDEEPFIFRYPSLTLPISVDIPAAIPVSPFMDRLIPSLKLDIIHTHHPFLLGQVAANKAEELDTPLIFTFHTQYREYTHYVPFSQDIVQDFIKDRIQVWLQEFMGRCQHIIVPSGSMQEILTTDYGLEDRFTVIPTGIDLEPYQTADGEEIRRKHGWENDQVIISVGRLAQEKNWDLLLEAAATAWQSHSNLRVVLLGDGPEKANLEVFARELGIAERVTFMGKVPFSQVPAFLKSADLFGFASTSETQGLVTMEALASGLPVVAVEAPGTRDIVQHEVQGLLVEEDAEALAKAIDEVLKDKERYQQLKVKTLARAQEFELNNQAKSLIRVYEQAIEDRKNNRFVQIRQQG